MPSRPNAEDYFSSLDPNYSTPSSSDMYHYIPLAVANNSSFTVPSSAPSTSIGSSPKSTSFPLTLICTLINCQSIANKVLLLDSYILQNKCDIVLLTETWLDLSLPDSFLGQPNFQIFRSDRVGKRGGGTAVMVRNKYPSAMVLGRPNFTTVPLFDITVIDLSIGRYNYRFICAYRTPGVNPGLRADAELLSECIKSLLLTNYIMVVVGDFNLPDVDWELLTSPIDGVQDVLLDMFMDSNLEQLVDFPTRVNNTLDLVLCTNASFIIDIKPSMPLGLSDHESVLFSLSCPSLLPASTPELTKPISVKNFWDAAGIINALYYLNSYDWSLVFNPLIGPELIWQRFKDSILTCISSFSKPFKARSFKHCSKNSFSNNQCNLTIKRLTSKKLKTWKQLKNVNLCLKIL